jgi:hypothetical protein
LYQGACTLAQANASLAQTMVEDALNTSSQLLSAKSPQEACTMMFRQIEPGLQRVGEYQKTVASIGTSLQGTLSGIADLQKATIGIGAGMGTATGQGESQQQALAMTMNPLAAMQSMLSGDIGGYTQALKAMQATMEGMQGQFQAIPGMFLPGRPSS